MAAPRGDAPVVKLASCLGIEAETPERDREDAPPPMPTPGKAQPQDVRCCGARPVDPLYYYAALQQAAMVSYAYYRASMKAHYRLAALRGVPSCRAAPEVEAKDASSEAEAPPTSPPKRWPRMRNRPATKAARRPETASKDGSKDLAAAVARFLAGEDSSDED
eukprot:TRINITY_DN113459_c0_g1_i1.p1 TRINITY_DN113459_c0_g1~~TRINITY_DN113459_c0_g1_i1.p1  ORF type:complete len:190 (+),score=47.12 TRINITY_DN113459_c0_g1_i1:83-571(+)